MKKSILILFFVTLFLCIIYILSQKPSNDVKEISIKEKIKNEIANDVFIPSEYNDKGILFLNQVKNKESYFPNQVKQDENIEQEDGVSDEEVTQETPKMNNIMEAYSKAIARK